tara:strand:+ start:2980 stop:4260 length:1281 start_codon:yes stop_codon:yes gene_type:complete
MKNALPTTAFVVVVTNQFTKISSGLQVDTNYIERLERVTKNQEQFQTLFDTIYEKIVSFICFQSDNEPIVLTNWVVSTWFYKSFQFTPYIHIFSPTEQCGKSRLLEVLNLMAYRVTSTNQPSNAVYRLIDSGDLCLFIDEIDKNDNEQRQELIGILNAGYEQSSTGVLRMVGSNHEPKLFSTFCPKVFSGIGRDKLAKTLRDRSIPIDLQRKAETDQTRRFLKTRHLLEEFEMDITLHLEQLSSEVEEDFNPYFNDDDYLECIELLAESNPNDRAVDICAPLLTIASMGSDEWALQTLNALNELTVREPDEQNWKIELLEKCREIMQNNIGQDRITSRELANEVNNFLDSRFVNWNNGNGLNGSNVSKALKDYNIKSKTIRIGGDTAKGFYWNDFLTAFEKYLPPIEEVEEKEVIDIDDIEQGEIF